MLQIYNKKHLLSRVFLIFRISLLAKQFRVLILQLILNC